MPETTPEQILARAQVAAGQRPPGPQGRDRARRARAVRRVVAARAAVASEAAAVHPRRAGRLVGLGALSRVLRRTRLGGPRAQPAQPLLVADRGPGDAVVRHLHGGRRRDARSVRVRRRRRRSRDGWPAGAQGRRADADRRPRPAQLRAAARAARAGPPARAARDPRGLRQVDDRLGDAPRAPVA